MGVIAGVVLTSAIFIYMHVLAGSNSPKLSNVWKRPSRMLTRESRSLAWMWPTSSSTKPK
jgi:hypothetical protein